MKYIEDRNGIWSVSFCGGKKSQPTYDIGFRIRIRSHHYAVPAPPNAVRIVMLSLIHNTIMLQNQN